MKINVTVVRDDGNALWQEARANAAQQVRDLYAPIFNRVQASNHGQSVDVIKEALRRELVAADLPSDDAKLSEYAEKLATGEPLTISVDPGF